ncbi:MAG: hypothetical protein IJ467_08085 [Bacteroidaceae bacterium]|nr:hypothetical protein [Bacteroidaceae bacterium]
MRQRILDATERHRIARTAAGHIVKESDDVWAQAPCFGPYSIEEINRELDQAEAEEEAGLGTPHETFMKEMREYILTPLL